MKPTKMRVMRLLVSLLLLGCLFSCQSHKGEENLSQLPVYQSSNFQFVAGEELKYQINLGLLKVGYLQLRVATTCDTISGKIAIPISASAHTRAGVKWITQIEHRWSSWIDTATGNTLKMNRYARENKYISRESVDFTSNPDSVLQMDLDEPGKVNKTDRKKRQPSDFVNLIWKLRYTDFARIMAGDTTTYSAYFDKSWYYFRIRNEGSDLYKWKGKKRKVFKLVPVGTAARFLKGSEPATLFLEAASPRRILGIELSTYFGQVSMELM